MKIFSISAILLVVGLLTLGCTNTGQQISPTSQTTASVAESSSPSVIATPAATVSAQNINIFEFSFTPASLTIKKGTTVTWTNRDSVPHTVTSDSNAFDSGSLAKDKAWTRTFNEAGEFTYHCSVHPAMKGNIVVSE